MITVRHDSSTILRPNRVIHASRIPSFSSSAVFAFFACERASSPVPYSNSVLLVVSYVWKYDTMIQTCYVQEGAFGDRCIYWLLTADCSAWDMLLCRRLIDEDKRREERNQSTNCCTEAVDVKPFEQTFCVAVVAPRFEIVLNINKRRTINVLWVTKALLADDEILHFMAHRAARSSQAHCSPGRQESYITIACNMKTILYTYLYTYHF